MTMNSEKNKVIAIVGPTASGKTAYSIELAKKLDGEIISADSRLVYKGFNIGTAKPTIEERENIPHHMIDIVEPEINYSAGLYIKEAKKIINNILKKGKTPIVVGGTGLYLNILLMNFELPEVEPNYALREQLKKENNLHEILKELDCETAKTIEPNDKKKLIRAIEIVKTTGKKLSEVRGINELEYNVEWHGRNFPRAELYDRINKRVDIMLETGLVEETKQLLKKHGRINNILYTIGYQEMVEYLDGTTTLEEATEKLKQNTRRYAKRQLTWFRKNEAINWNVYPETLKK